MSYRSRCVRRRELGQRRRRPLSILDAVSILKRRYAAGAQPKWARAAYARNWLTSAQFDEICRTTKVSDGFAMQGGLEELFYANMPVFALVPKAAS